MKLGTILSALSLAAFARAACNDNADGFASLNGGTTGGNGGTVVTVTTQADLEKYASASGKHVIKIPGRITITPKGKEIDITNDKTVIGEGANGEIYNGGFKIINRKNVIIRNLRIGNTEGGEELDWDGIQVDTSTNIWIDHCILEKIGDGGIDLRKDTSYFTVSHTHFKGVDKAFGIGWTDNVVSRGTIHHSYLDGTNQRGPSADNLQYAHLYNNYIRGVTSYGHYARGKTNARVENVYFQSTKNPLQADDTASLYSSGSIFQSCSGRQDSNRGTTFDPKSFYSYTLDATANIPSLVTSNVGPRASVCPTGSSNNPNPNPNPNPTPGTVPQFGQCGGSGWTGATACQAPFTCKASNEWYSQCL